MKKSRLKAGRFNKKKVISSSLSAFRQQEDAIQSKKVASLFNS